jgi:hypothetical protein
LAGFPEFFGHRDVKDLAAGEAAYANGFLLSQIGRERDQPGTP